MGAKHIVDTSEPLISVIIPFFASHDLLPQCLTSVAQHMSLPYEIILVDDGNANFDFTDIETTPHLTLARLPENRGLSAARNEGFKTAKGEWVLWLDSDDLLTGDPAAYFVAMGRAGSEQSEIILGTLSGNKVLPAFADRVPFSTRLGDDIKLVKTGTFSAHLYRTDFLRTHTITFPDGISAAEDLVFLMRVLAAAQNVTVSDVAVYRVTEREGSLSRQGLRFENYRMRFSKAAPLVMEALRDFPQARAARMSMIIKYGIAGLQKRLDTLTESEKSEAFAMLRAIVTGANLTSDMATDAGQAANVAWEPNIDEMAGLVNRGEQSAFLDRP